MSYQDYFKYDDNYLLKIIKPSIEDIYKNYRYVLKSEVILHNIALNEISVSRREYDGKVPYADYIAGKVIEDLDNFVNFEINNPENSYNLINSYILKMFDDKLNFKKSLDYFKQLDAFFEKYNYIPDPDMITDLINKNHIYNEMAKKVVNKNMKSILNGDYYSDNETLMATVNCYCTLNGIEVKEEVLDFDESELSKYDELSLLRKDIRDYPLLSAEEEIELANKMANGDEEARDKFINSNIRLSMSKANKYRGRGVSYPDLVQEGFLGLITAANKFNPDKGFKFSTYASWWIKRAMIYAVRTYGKTIRIPYNRYDEIHKFKKEYDSLVDKLDREPTIDEIAESLKIDNKKALEIYMMQADPVSLSTPIGEGEDSIELGDLIPTKKNAFESVYKNDLAREVSEFLKESGLSPRQIDILLKRNAFYENRIFTLEECAAPYNITRERVRQIETDGYGKLRLKKKIKKFLIYMDDPRKAEQNLEKFNEEYYERKRNKSNKSSRPKTIYEAHSRYPKDIVDMVLSKLDRDELELLHEKYGDDFNVPPVIDYLPKEKAKIYREELGPKMQNMLKTQLAYRNRVIKNIENMEKKNEEDQRTIEEDMTEEMSPFLIELEKINRRQANENSMDKIKRLAYLKIND